MTTAESRFVYVTYIRTTAEKVWAALTSPDFAEKYWRGARPVAEWKAGGSWKLVFPDGRVADTGEIVAFEPEKRLAIRWRNEWMPELKAEGWSLCTMEIEPVEDAVKLTVTHSIDRSEFQAHRRGLRRLAADPFQPEVDPGDGLGRTGAEVRPRLTATTGRDVAVVEFCGPGVAVGRPPLPVARRASSRTYGARRAGSTAPPYRVKISRVGDDLQFDQTPLDGARNLVFRPARGADPPYIGKVDRSVRRHPRRRIQLRLADDADADDVRRRQNAAAGPRRRARGHREDENAEASCPKSRLSHLQRSRRTSPRPLRHVALHQPPGARRVALEPRRLQSERLGRDACGSRAPAARPRPRGTPHSPGRPPLGRTDRRLSSSGDGPRTRPARAKPRPSE